MTYMHNWILFSFPGGSDSKASVYNAGDPGSIPGLGRSLEEGNGNPLQYSCLKNSTDCLPRSLVVDSPWSHKEADTTFIPQLFKLPHPFNYCLLACLNWTPWQNLYLFFFWLHCPACEILFPGTGIEPGPSAVTVQSPNHWTTREFLEPISYRRF